MNIKILILIILIFLLFGCTEMTRDQKNLCYSLTSKSYDFIPTCTTEDSCYKKVDDLFNTNLGFEQENNLYKLKNSFARSWFFYNKGITQVRKISKLCQKGIPSTLPGPINQTKFYLNESLKEMEKGIEESINLISIEEEKLTNNEIDLIKEEELFYSLTQIRQSLIDLKNENTKSDNFVSFYLNKIENYNKKFAIKTGNLIEKESILMKTYSFTKKTWEEENSSTKLPIISSYFIRSLPFLENLLYLSESLRELKSLPNYEFMKLYSNISGNKNSVLSHFAKLINNTSKNLEKVNKLIPKYWSDVELLKNNSNGLIKIFKSQKEFTIISNKLLTKKIQPFSDLEKEHETLIKQIFNLKQNKARGISIGKELSSLKEIKNKLILLNHKLEDKKVNEFDLMINKCKEKANKIKGNSKSFKLDNLNQINSEIKYYANLLLKDKKLIYCSKMLTLEDELLTGINDYETLKLQQKELTKNCFSDLDKLFGFYDDLQLMQSFNSLKNEVVTENNLFYFKESCLNIKNQILKQISTDLTIKEIQKEYEYTNLILEKLKLLSQYSNDKDIKKTIKNINAELENISKYFLNKKVNSQEIFPVKETILKLLQNKNKEYQNTYHIQLEKTLIRLIQKQVITQTKTIANQENKSILKIILTNPFEKLNKTIYLDLELINPKLINNISYAKVNEFNNKLILDYFPEGINEIKFEINKSFNFKETDKIIYATNNESLINKNILLDFDETINQLTFKLPVFNAWKIIVLKDEIEQPFLYSNNSLEFNLKNINSKSKINILIYLKNKISLNKDLVNTKAIGQNAVKLTYNIKAKNLFSEKISATLLIPLNSKEKINKINIYDEQMTNKRFTFINSQAVLKNQKFDSKEIRNYQLIVEVDNLYWYYEEQLLNLKEQSKKLNIDNSSEIEKLLNLELNNDTIKEIEQFIKIQNKLIQNKKIEIDKQIQLDLLQNSVLEQLENLKIKKNEAIDLDLENIAIQIQEQIAIVQKLFNSNELDKALNILSNQEFKIDEEILENIQEIYKNLPKSKNNKLNEINEKIFNIKNEIEKTIYSNPLNSQKLFKEIISLEEEFYLTKNKIEIEKNNSDQNRKIEINKFYEENLGLLKKLEKELYELDLKENKLKIIYPITNKRLRTLKIENENLLLENNVNNLLKLKEINFELKNALNQFRKEAIIKFNESIDKGNTDKTILTKSKELIDKNEYVNAMFMLNTPNQTNFIWALPIIIIIIISVFIKFKFKKTTLNKENKKQKIIDSWKD